MFKSTVTGGVWVLAAIVQWVTHTAEDAIFTQCWRQTDRDVRLGICVRLSKTCQHIFISVGNAHVDSCGRGFKCAGIKEQIKTCTRVWVHSISYSTVPLLWLDASFFKFSYSVCISVSKQVWTCVRQESCTRGSDVLKLSWKLFFLLLPG